MPSTTLYETDGIFVNQEGRAQMVRQAYRGGAPIVQSGGGDHPPEYYGTGIPGADPRPAWMVLAQLADEKLKSEGKALPATITGGAILCRSWPISMNPRSIADEGLRLNFR